MKESRSFLTLSLCRSWLDGVFDEFQSSIVTQMIWLSRDKYPQTRGGFKVKTEVVHLQRTALKDDTESTASSYHWKKKKKHD